MPYVPNSSTPTQLGPYADDAVPFSVTLTVADTSQLLVSAPVGKKIVSIDVEPLTNNDVAYLKPGAAATASPANAIRVDKKFGYGASGLSIDSFQFIGGAGQTPTVTGVAWVGQP